MTLPGELADQDFCYLTTTGRLTIRIRATQLRGHARTVDLSID